MPDIKNKRAKLTRGLGALLALDKIQYGIVGRTDYGDFKVTLYSEEIFRIHISLEGEFDRKSYAVVLDPQPVDFHLEQTNGSYILGTSKAVLKIDTNPVRFTLLTRDGKVINEDDSFGTSWSGERVTTYKKLQDP